MKKYGKFAALVVVIVGTLIWLATAGIKDNQTYYKTIAELGQMGDQAYSKRLRVGGDVGAGSIVRKGNVIEFVMVQEKLNLRVAYDGADPLPDTFRDGAQALADGKMGRDGVFHASKIQAKCASKYEAKPGGKPAAAPTYPSKASL
ncbi:MAG: cytochrome c maturation protein CcmE [Acidobacteriia bacterium]|nr:cytochrome c maturation protein CcmE [Terriglobia bacterium]